MHPNSLKLCREFFADVNTHYSHLPKTVLDVGSYNVNGCYRAIWDGWDYTGVDIAKGPNVDLVIPKDAMWSLGRQFGVVISGQCIEHCEDPFWLTQRMAEHVQPGGLLLLIAPFRWPQHRYPIDCWRFLPDGMRVLLRRAGLRCLKAEISEIDAKYSDCWAVGIKDE